MKLLNILNKQDNTLITDKPVWAIGDVHGCAEEFEDMIISIKEKDPNAIIFQLGDLIDRGEHLLDCFRVLGVYDINLILGNHELSFIQEYLGNKVCRSKARQHTHEQFTQLSKTWQDRILGIMCTAPTHFYVETGHSRWVLSHAPVLQTVLDKDVNNALQFCLTDQDNDYKESYLWARNIHGHCSWQYVDILQQIKENKMRINLDSGCVYGKQLTAIKLSDNITENDVIQIQAKQIYYKEY